MVHLSKQPLKVKFSKKIFKQLTKLTALSNKDNSTLFLEGLLTPSEQIMIAKRLAAVILLHGGRTPYEVALLLHMSQSTIGIMKEQYDAGQYAGVLALVGKSKKEKDEFMEFVGMLSRGGMPSMGKDRWKFLN